MVCGRLGEVQSLLLHLQASAGQHQKALDVAWAGMLAFGEGKEPVSVQIRKAAISLLSFSFASLGKPTLGCCEVKLVTACEGL